MGQNLNSDRQASEVLFEVHNISENAQLIRGENRLLMPWIIFQSAASSKLRVTDNRFWVKEEWAWCFFRVHNHDELIAIDNLDALWKIVTIINRKHRKNDNAVIDNYVHFRKDIISARERETETAPLERAPTNSARHTSRIIGVIRQFSLTKIWRERPYLNDSWSAKRFLMIMPIGFAVTLMNSPLFCILRFITTQRRRSRINSSRRSFE